LTAHTSTSVAADLAAGKIGVMSGNSGAMDFLQAGTGAVARSVESKLRDVVSVLDFGAVRNGVTDDTAAINAAITTAGVGGTIYFPKGTYLIKSQLTQLEGQSWIGEGGQRSTTLKKGFNGDFIIPGDRGALRNLNIECNGTSYSGRGIYVTAGYSLTFEHIRVSASAGVSLEFANDSGGGSVIIKFEGTTTNPTVVPAIKISDTTACPRFFDNIWLPGGLFDFSTGGNGSSLNNFYIRNFITGTLATCVLFHASNGRVASISDQTVLGGADITLSGIAFSGPVKFQNAQGYIVTNCTFGSGFTEDADNSQYNRINDQLKLYTPSWSQDIGDQPSIGNGELSGSYCRNGNTCTVTIRMVAGSTTTFGNDQAGYRFSLPLNAHQWINHRGIPIELLYNGTTYNCWGSIGSNEKTIYVGINGQGVRLDFPVTLGSGATINMTFTYNVR